ncbi:MAG: hypothetical protein K2X28_05370 [Alphaproteobacteria bacterium]|nr:hypothetical protein [Alphaproteobacteria bacterium]
MNFRQLTLLLCIGTGIAYPCTAHAMNEEDLQSITPAGIVLKLKDLEESQTVLIQSVGSLRQQLEEQTQYNVLLTKQLGDTHDQLDKLTESLRSLLTPNPAAPSTS